ASATAASEPRGRVAGPTGAIHRPRARRPRYGEGRASVDDVDDRSAAMEGADLLVGLDRGQQPFARSRAAAGHPGVVELHAVDGAGGAQNPIISTCEYDTSGGEAQGRR